MSHTCGHARVHVCIHIKGKRMKIRKAKHEKDFHMRISRDLLRRLRKQSARQGLDQTRLVRRLIIRYLDDQELQRNLLKK